MDVRSSSGRRKSLKDGPRDGDTERAHVPGLARGIPAHRPSWILQLLRSVYPHRRLDGQPACQVAEGDTPDPLAQADCIAELPAQFARLAAGSQWILAP